MGQFGSLDAPRGIKRPAEDDLMKEQPLTKRLSLLSLGTPNYQAELILTHSVGLTLTDHQGPARAEIAPLHAATTGGEDGGTFMQVDDTKHRVFVADLDEELSDEDRQGKEGQIVFLSDVDKQLTKIPASILTSPTPPPSSTSQELVLYNVPTSLSIPEEQDNVRKAIIETRARLLERQAEDRIFPGEEIHQGCAVG